MCGKLYNTIEVGSFSTSPIKLCNDDVHGNIITINEPITYKDFFERFMQRNRPCIFSNFITKDWSCLQNWVLDGKPNFPYLRDNYGESSVPVADCKERYYNAQKKATYKLSDYLKYWQDHGAHDEKEVAKKSLYLKDWHMVRDYPDVHEYIVPMYFASDWLNEYFSVRKDLNDDYRFVYMGPKDTWTPLHADVYSSYSWSVNVCGRKRWILFPPGEEEYLKDKLGNLVYDVECSELENDREKYPQYKNLKFSYEVIQEPGEAIFVPSGWHHQVWNLEDTISINHNWLNGCNILSMWESLQQSLVAVQKEVEDCRDMVGWEHHCQIMLRATYGLNYEEFFGLLKHIGQARLRMLQEGEELTQSGSWLLGEKHALWDLSRVYTVLKNLLSDPNAASMDWFERHGCYTPQELVSDIKSVIKEHSELWDSLCK